MEAPAAAVEEPLAVTVLVQPDTRHQLSLDRGATVAQLRGVLRSAHLGEGAVGRSIVLVAAGRVMQDSELLSAFVPRDDAGSNLVVHCMVTDAAPPTVPRNVGTMRGFDRLRVFGLDEAQVALFRQLYLQQAVEEVGAAVPREPGEEEAARLLRVEEHWIVRQGANSEFGLNLRTVLAGGGGGGGGGEDDDAAPGGARPAMNPWLAGGLVPAEREPEPEPDAAERGGGRGQWQFFVLGFATGYFLGFIALVFLCNSGLSQRFKLGVSTGMLANIVAYALFGPPADTAAPPPPIGLASEPEPRSPNFPPVPLVDYVPPAR